MPPPSARQVPVVFVPTRPRTVTRVSSTDVHTTSYVLQHPRQRDAYCYEKLRLTPPDQFARGGRRRVSATDDFARTRRSGHGAADSITRQWGRRNA